MEQTTEIDSAAIMLAHEIAQAHANILALNRLVTPETPQAVQLDCMKVTARLIQAQASAVLSLKRLTSEGHHTLTVVHQGGTPTPQKSKTNVPARKRGGDGATVHRP